MDNRDLMTENERLKDELDKLKAKEKTKREIYLKISQKGALSLYGLGRFPVTLYKEQWEKLLEKVADIKDFINKNEGSLKTKD